jgi:hypothetical protein
MVSVSIVALLGALALALPGASAEPPPTSLERIPIAGTYADVHGARGTFDGSFAGECLVAAEGRFGLAGTASIALSDPSDRVIATVEDAITVPVTDLATAPTTLSLTLGPGRVVLMGLQLDVEPVAVELATPEGAVRRLADLLSDAASSPASDEVCG